MDNWVEITAERGLVQPFRARVTSMLPMLRMWTHRELRARYRQSFLRAGWSVVQPTALLVTYGWVLTEVLSIGQESIPYLSFAWCGLVPFALVQSSLGPGVSSIQANGSLISKIYFPREILPLAEVGAACTDLLASVPILIVLSWVQIGPPTVHTLAIFPALAVLVMWVAALTVLSATATVFRRDLKHAMPLLLRILFIVTPIMYPITAFGEAAEKASLLNPLTVVIEVMRDGTLRHQWPRWDLLALQGLAGAILLVVSILVVQRTERRMPDAV